MPSKKAAYKAVKRGEILVNGGVVQPQAVVRAGDVIRGFEPASLSLPRSPASPAVLYCDSCVAVIVKPAGIPVMGLFKPSLELACATALPPSNRSDALPRAKPVHRLDVPTTGLVLVARTEWALRDLSRQFHDREVRKTYRAVVAGFVAGTVLLDIPLDGKPSRTEAAFDRPARSLHDGCVTAVTLHPHTGRRHQLRRHLAAIGHPVLGDREYSPGESLFRGKGLFLSATGIAFRHPERSDHLGFRIDQPHKFTSYLEREERRYWTFAK